MKIKKFRVTVKILQDSRFFHSPGYDCNGLFLLLKHELKPNCFDNRNAKIFSRIIVRKTSWIFDDLGFGAIREQNRV